MGCGSSQESQPVANVQAAKYAAEDSEKGLGAGVVDPPAEDDEGSQAELEPPAASAAVAPLVPISLYVISWHCPADGGYMNQSFRTIAEAEGAFPLVPNGMPKVLLSPEGEILDSDSVDGRSESELASRGKAYLKTCLPSAMLDPRRNGPSKRLGSTESGPPNRFMVSYHMAEHGGFAIRWFATNQEADVYWDFLGPMVAKVIIRCDDQAFIRGYGGQMQANVRQAGYIELAKYAKGDPRAEPKFHPVFEGAADVARSTKWQTETFPSIRGANVRMHSPTSGRQLAKGDVPSTGVHVNWLKQFAHRCVPKHFTTLQVVQNLIQPMTAATKCRYTDLMYDQGIPNEQMLRYANLTEEERSELEDKEIFTPETGLSPLARLNVADGLKWVLPVRDPLELVPIVARPNAFVSHQWSNNFHDLVNRIEHFAKSQLMKRWRDVPNISDEDQLYPWAVPNCWVWLDIFAIMQHPGVEQNSDLGQLKTAISNASDGLLVMMDSEFNMLKRVWCLYEINHGLSAASQITWDAPKSAVEKFAYDKEVKGDTGEEVFHRPRLGNFASVIDSINYQKGEATVDKDRVKIIADIEAGDKDLSFNKRIQKAIYAACHTKAAMLNAHVSNPRALSQLKSPPSNYVISVHRSDRFDHKWFPDRSSALAAFENDQSLLGDATVMVNNAGEVVMQKGDTGWKQYIAAYLKDLKAKGQWKNDP